jgi:hypothetical protein
VHALEEEEEYRQSRNLTGENSSLDAAAAGVRILRRRWQIGDAPLPLRDAENAAAASADATSTELRVRSGN